MKIKDLVIEEKQKGVDGKACWDGYKRMGTKKKGGKTVDNCVKMESAPHPQELEMDAKVRSMQIQNRADAVEKRNAAKQAEPKNIFQKVKKDIGGPISKLAKGDIKGSLSEAGSAAQQAAIAISMKKAGKKPKKVDEGVAETITMDDAKKVLSHYGADHFKTTSNELHFYKNGQPMSVDLIWGEGGKRSVNLSQLNQVARQLKGQGMAEGFNGEYDDEAGMADNNLETLKRAVDGLDNIIGAGDNLPEWCQEKIAVAKSMLVTVWDYMASEEGNEDPEIAEMYEALEQFVYETAENTNADVDLVWETFESMDDTKLFETAAWRRSAGKSKKGGLNAKGVASYRREHPGSKLQMAVTTKPSKLKPGSKAAKRRKSFCARMSGVKGPMKKPNGKPTRKALALRKWNC